MESYLRIIETWSRVPHRKKPAVFGHFPLLPNLLSNLRPVQCVPSGYIHSFPESRGVLGKAKVSDLLQLMGGLASGTKSRCFILSGLTTHLEPWHLEMGRIADIVAAAGIVPAAWVVSE